MQDATDPDAALSGQSLDRAAAAKNIALYPWFKFFQNLIFWQSVWFLYFQTTLSAAEAILLYVVFDLATTILEVPSGYMSDRLGRKRTLVASAVTGIGGCTLLAFGDSFAVFAVGQVFLGASIAFASGTDNALLYESLLGTGRQSEIEKQELRAWRFAFTALALSAFTGGILALEFGALPFAAGGIAFVCVLAITSRFSDPPPSQATIAQGHEILRFRALVNMFKSPVLLWLFALSVLMYVFGHILFVFGQPFIFEAMKGTGFEEDAPLVSGSVSTVMMTLSVLTSLVALWLRRKIGLAAIVLLAFGIQIALIGALAVNNSMVVIAFLFLRMVPDSLSDPFIMARIQPILNSDVRATYLSLQSLLGRLILAATLFLASFWSSTDGQMPYSEIQSILGWYLAAGLLCLAVLAALAKPLGINDNSTD